MRSLPLSRRALIGSTAAALALPAILRAAAPQLALYGPPAGPSVTLAQAVASGALAELAGEVTLTIWRNPDELRAGLASGQIAASVVPVQTAANLYNRGMGLRLVNTMTDGLLSILAPEGALTGLAGLAGQRLAVPFVNDTPDFILRAVLAHHGLTDSVELVPTGSPIEAAQMLLSGRIGAALLSEPASSGVILMGGMAGKTFARAVDLQDEWAAISNGLALPQAGLAVTEAFDATLIPPLQAALVQATADVLADPEAAAAAAAPAFDLPAPVIAASIPHSRLITRAASEARPAIEAMLALMARDDPAIIGGHLPDDGFYAL